MYNFEEDKTNTYVKGTKELKEVVMKFTDGTEQVVQATEPTMVLIGYKEYQELRKVYETVVQALRGN